MVLKRAWFLKRVVPPFSGASYFGDHFRVAGSDHFSISKPEGPEAIQHRLLCRFIQKITHTGFDLSKVSESNGELRTVVSSCEICVTVGRIENYLRKEGTVVALPCNEYFDDRCTDDARSALGAYVQPTLSR